ncbi:hypothetical protein GGI07_002862 [Coemansia sp. Benny D115]|nr:hypothetical protein GGI07_002862 [Coemansia sp. Benny D115]
MGGGGQPRRSLSGKRAEEQPGVAERAPSDHRLQEEDVGIALDEQQRQQIIDTMAAGHGGFFHKQRGATDYREDEDLVHAMARQYVLDAEAAGSASPSYRSRKNTDADKAVPEAAERTVGRDVTTASSSEGQQQYGQQHRKLSAGPDYDSSESMGVPPVPPVPVMPQDHTPMTSTVDAEKSGVLDGGGDSVALRVMRSKSDSQTTTDGGYAEDQEDLHNLSSSGSVRDLSERLRSEEVEDDANEARFFVPARMRYPAPKYNYAADTAIPAGAILFVLGFLVLPLWWIGAVFPRAPGSGVARTWRKYNALMTLLSLPLLGLFLALGGWQAVHG